MSKQIKSFLSQDEGSLTVEAVLVLPLLFIVFMSTFTYFDVFRAKSLALKGNYAVSDMMSRDDNNVTPQELKGLGNLHRYLTNSSTKSWIRATVVWCHKMCDAKNQSKRKLRVLWSRGFNQPVRLKTADVRARYNDIFPKMYNGEYLLLVESSATYTPPFAGAWTGIFPHEIVDRVVTKPRDGPKICFDKVACNPGDE